MPIKFQPTVRLLEKDIQRTCEDALQLDGWRIFRLEENWSDKKRKSVGEKNAPDALCIRYEGSDDYPFWADVLFVEWKRPEGKASAGQKAWHRDERARGALTWIAGEDFPATIDGFLEHYRKSGLNHGRV